MVAETLPMAGRYSRYSGAALSSHDRSRQSSYSVRDQSPVALASEPDELNAPSPSASMLRVLPSSENAGSLARSCNTSCTEGSSELNLKATTTLSSFLLSPNFTIIGMLAVPSPITRAQRSISILFPVSEAGMYIMSPSSHGAMPSPMPPTIADSNCVKLQPSTLPSVN